MGALTISKKGIYALRAMIELARVYDKSLTIANIAKSQD